LRSIKLDDATLTVLKSHMDLHRRIAAGIPDGAEADLSLIRLDGLIFPSLRGTPRDPRNVTREFADRAEQIGFGRIRLHDLRGIRATALLDAGIPPHTVAQRLGNDPAVLLRSYAKRRRTAQADERLCAAVANLTSGW
jgi:integrase